MTRLSVFPVLVALFGLPCFSAGAWEMSGSKAVVAHTADGARIHLGSIVFTPKANGAVEFNVSLDPTPFSDHFLSMREFKCVQASAELTCHVPYPYPNPRTVTRADLAWLEHSLLFFYKRPSEFGAKLWNGIYFEFKDTEAGLVGTPQAIDLNSIAAPPKDASLPPFRRALRDAIPPDARWIRSLSIE